MRAAGEGQVMEADGVVRGRGPAGAMGAVGDDAAARQAGLAGRGTWRFRVLLVVLPMVLVVVGMISCGVGAVPIPLGHMVRAAVGRGALTETERVILTEIRLPRVLASGVVGAALAVSGLLFQGLFRNPMADPYVIGSSGGAVLGACVGIFFLAQVSLWGFSATALLAFAGSVVTMVGVYALARTGGRTNIVTLLLAGFAVSTMLGYSTYFFELLDTSSGTNNRVLIAWLHGVIGTPVWGQLGLTAGMFAVAMVAAVPLTRRLNALTLGDEYAAGLGMRVEATRVCLILVGSMLTSVAVSLGGLISFAGLIVPHVARLLLGPDHVRLLPVTALGGAIFLMVADTLARTLFRPAELPVGVLMAVLGGPFFLYLLRKTKRGYAV